MAQASWHQTPISKGVFGELSKVAEELAELADTIEQQQPVMTLIELSDIVGAVDGVLARRGSSVEKFDQGTAGTLFHLDGVLAQMQKRLRSAQEAEAAGNERALAEALRELVELVCFSAAARFNVDFDGLLRFARLRSAIILDELHAD